MEAHPTISTEKKGASHSLVGYNVHLNQIYSTGSRLNGDGVHCEKANDVCQKRTTSSPMYVSDAS